MLHYSVTVAGAGVDLRSLEQTALGTDPDTSFINSANVILPASTLSGSAQTVVVTRVDTGKIKLQTSNINQHNANVTLAQNQKVRLTTSNVNYSNLVTTISNVDTANNTITVNADFTDEDGNIVVIGSGGWNVTSFTVLQDLPLHAQRHTIANLTSTGFTVTQSNVTANVAATDLQINEAVKRIMEAIK